MRPELFRALKTYDKKDLPKDLMAGLMVAIIALPLSIALGLQSGATLQQGILTAIIAGFFISFLGGSRYQIGGPTAAFVVIIVGYVSDPAIGFTGLGLATIGAGILLVLLGLCRAGGLVRYIPYPIVIGFTAGVGVTLLVGQLKDLSGITLPTGTGSDVVDKVVGLVKGAATCNPWALGLGAVTIALIYLIPKISKKLPAAFCAVVIATVAALCLNTFAGANIATIGSTYGEVKAEFYTIDLSGLETLQYSKLIMPVIVIALLGAIESLLSATVADGMTGAEHDPNQELVGQGVANVASGLCGGLPATGAIARTAAGINNGAKSPLTGVFHALFLLAMYLVLMPVMKFIPLTGLAAILITVSLHMANLPLFARLATFGVRDTLVLLAAFFLTVFFDLTYGVIGGLVLCCLVNLPNLIAPVKVTGQEVRDGKARLALDGKLCFLSVVSLCDKAAAQAVDHDQVALDFARIGTMDVTAAERLSKLAAKLGQKGKTLTLEGLSGPAKTRYERFVAEVLHKGGH